jgi:hypothetical protein
MMGDQKVFERAGKKGGKARARNMTPEERSEAARNAVKSRWQKAKGAESSADASTSNIRKAVFPIREGEVTFIFPNNMSSNSAIAVTSYFNLMMDQLVNPTKDQELEQGAPEQGSNEK